MIPLFQILELITSTKCLLPNKVTYADSGDWDVDILRSRYLACHKHWVCTWVSLVDKTPKAQTVKEKIDKLDIIKRKSFVFQRAMSKLSEWSKIFVNYIPDMQRVSSTYKELLQLNRKRTQLKIDKGSEWAFLQAISTWKDGQYH